MLMMWADFLPTLYVTTILDVEFFPKWLTAVHRWLGDTADYATVALWYQGWKDRFPADLRSAPRATAQFSAALTLMEQAVQDHENQGAPLPAGAREQMDYICVLEHRRMQAATARQHEHAAPEAAVAMENARGRGLPRATFKDVVEEYAARKEVVFLPKSGRRHDGRQILAFGPASVSQPERALRGDADEVGIVVPTGTGRPPGSV